MTRNDEELVRQARRLNVANYWDGDKLKAKCDSDEARGIIDRIMRRLYHLEEAQNEME
jgi:hypothetical protein